ncbi:MAG: hypothetical protein H7833_19345, partial [Magnetococcus sp. DMHC-1]
FLRLAAIIYSLTKRWNCRISTEAKQWHMRQALAPLLFDDDDKETAKASRSDPVSPSKRSKKAQKKAATKQTETGFPVQSFQSLLKNLATLCRNTVRMGNDTASTFSMLTNSTPLQAEAFRLLGISPGDVM